MDKEMRQVTVDHMKKTLEHLHHELASIRTGRASAALLDAVKVDYFGSLMPVKHVATVSVPDAKTIMVQPFQANMLAAIEKAIYQSDLGLTPNNDGHVIRMTIPQLTEERGRDLTKVVKKLGEDTKVAVRNVRRETIEKLRAAQKNSEITEDQLKRDEKEVQDLTDEYITEVDKTLEAKEKEIMTV